MDFKQPFEFGPFVLVDKQFEHLFCQPTQELSQSRQHSGQPWQNSHRSIVRDQMHLSQDYPLVE